MKLQLRRPQTSSRGEKPTAKLPQNVVLPNHVALICDGNRRWAAARGMSTFEGHKAGADAIGEILKACREFGIHTFTAWAFSTENWDRDIKEIKGIFRLIGNMIDKYIKDAKKDDVRIIHLGREDRIPEFLLKKFKKAEEETKNNKSYVFNIAVDYGGNDEIMRAARKMLDDGIDPQNVDRNSFASYLDTRDQPYPYVDLLIRTSGEQRLSGILPWQMEYAEIWWEEDTLPAFTREKFIEVLLDYSRRRRRYGTREDGVRKIDFQPKIVAKFDLDWRRAMELKEQGKFKAAFINYMREQFGISLQLAKEATEMFLKALIKGETEGDWKGTKRILTKFYKLLQDNVKLAFEPSLVASLEIDYLKGSNGDKQKKVELHEIITKLYAELFRIPLLQAGKVAHLRVLAQEQEEEAKLATGKNKERLVKKAEEYLVRSYEALKERIA